MILLLIVLLVAGLLSGGFYGLAYLKAKANKTSVASELVKQAEDLTKPKT